MILFGPAGIPTSKKGKGLEEGIREVARLGLDCMEVEFVRGVRLKHGAAVGAGAAAREEGIVLTAHAPYYINLCSLDPEKADASEERILQTARMCHLLGGTSVTFHAAYYQGRDPGGIFQMVEKRLRAVGGKLLKEGIGVSIAPELTGKPAQFGSLEELIRLSRGVKGVQPCIDFSHYVARSGGGNNNYDGFLRALKSVKRGLGVKALRRLHMHVSGIEWGAKGEKRHLMLEDSEFDWKALLRVLVDLDISGIIICESPMMEEDATIMKMEYMKRLRKKR
jgi:deoxyribonuclease-4